MLRPVHAPAGASRRRMALACALALASCSGAALAQSPSPAPAPQTQPEAKRPAWMGVRAAPGVLVQDVIPDGPADEAGMKSGDLLTGVNGKSPIEAPGLMGALASSSPGDTLVLDIMRDGEEMRLKLVLGEFPLEYLEERETALAKDADSWAKSPPSPPPPAPPELPLDAPRADLRFLGAEQRPFLGVRLQELTEGLAAYFGMPDDSVGVLVEHVHEDSPAEKAGLEAGDVLVSVDDTRLANMTDLGEQLRLLAPGDVVTLIWWREGKHRQARVPLASRAKDIWVVSPPGETRENERDAERTSLEARLRAIEEQGRILKAEREALMREIERLRAATKPRAIPKP